MRERSTFETVSIQSQEFARNLIFAAGRDGFIRKIIEAL